MFPFSLRASKRKAGLESTIVYQAVMVRLSDRCRDATRRARAQKSGDVTIRSSASVIHSSVCKYAYMHKHRRCVSKQKV